MNNQAIIEKDWYTGEALQRAVFETPEERKFLINSIIPEHSITCFYAPDGAGKSTLSLQMCIEAASGKAVFNGFPVEKPIKSIYIMAERHRFEAFERIKLMSTQMDINWENICITDKLQGFNLLHADDRIRFNTRVKQIADYMGGVDYVHIDPMYALVPEKMVGEEGAAAMRMTCQRIMSEIGCSTGFNHHSNRGVRDKEGKRTGEDMYGGRFISATCTGMFAIKPNEGRGTIFTKEKDSMSCLVGQFSLFYNPETHLSMVNPDEGIWTKTERLKQFFSNYLKLKKDFSFDDIKSVIDLSHAHIRRELMRQVKGGVLINLKPIGAKALYRVLREPL